MKKLGFLFLLLSLACSKEKVEKSLGDQVGGNYDVPSIEVNGQSAAVPIVSGSTSIDFEMVISKVSDTQAKLSLTQITTENGTPKSSSASSDNIDLVKNDSGEIEFQFGGNKVGVFSSNTFKYFTQLSGNNVTFICTKK